MNQQNSRPTPATAIQISRNLGRKDNDRYVSNGDDIVLVKSEVNLVGFTSWRQGYDAVQTLGIYALDKQT